MGTNIIAIYDRIERLDNLESRLATIEKLLKKLMILVKGEILEMAALDDAITALQAEVANDTTVIQSADTLINGIAAQITAAVNAALAAGATPAQLTALSTLTSTLVANDTSLANAVAANTPSVSPAAQLKKS